jgi:hypothetical protein
VKQAIKQLEQAKLLIQHVVVRGKRDYLNKELING